MLYVDCVAGVAGDMLLGALLDAGADAERVRSGLGGLGIEGLELRLERAERHAIAATRARVVAAPGQPERTWASARELIDGAGLPARAHARAQEALARLARAEGRVHGVPPEQVHLHEAGAVDALAEVCGVALALEELDVERVVCSPLPMPRGFVVAAHGRLPLPAPGALELLKGAPLYGVEVDVELVTPTGAALVSSLAERYGPLPPMRLVDVGAGAGARDIDSIPNIVRVLLGEPLGAGGEGAVSLIETNLDDLVPELVPDAAESCFAAGALDVWATPAQMKKGRPGVVLSALARPADEHAVADALLRGTGTLGVRIGQLRRLELERDWHTVEVAGEQVRVKVGRRAGERISLAPEHDDCAAVAGRTGRTVRAVWAAALAAAHEQA